MKKNRFLSLLLLIPMLVSLLALPAALLWFAAEAVQHGYWFTATATLAWWLLLAIVFCIHRTYDKGLFGKRR